MTDERPAIYAQVMARLQALLVDETDLIAAMSTIVCEVYNAFDHFNWVGFYRVTAHDVLKVGPYQGGHGCLEIRDGKGVCGTCASLLVPQRVDDVRAVEHHIACSSETRSELVLPALGADNRLMAVFDIDSSHLSAFNEQDEAGLAEVVSLLREVDARTS
jgi:L-methionine (R)-S-oxide reductase